jgi:hypothetical protein
MSAMPPLKIFAAHLRTIAAALALEAHKSINGSGGRSKMSGSFTSVLLLLLGYSHFNEIGINPETQ